MKKNKNVVKIIAIILSVLMLFSACSGKPESTGDELFDAANAAASAQTALFEGRNGKLLSDSENFPAGTSVCDWTAMAFSVLGIKDSYKSYLSELENYVTEKYAEDGGLHRSKTTEWHRIALTVMALGGNPESFGKKVDGTAVNLIADGVYNFSGEDIGAQGTNAYIYALITLDARDFFLPADCRYSREYLLNALIESRDESGGFGILKGSTDIDITAMALQALAPYAGNDTVDGVINEALAVLSDAQNDDGTFTSWDITSSESCSQVIIALCSLGIDPRTDERFIKNGKSVFDALMSFRLSNGSFAHGIDEKEGNNIATEQAMLALCSMIKLRDGKRLYDFR